MIMQEKLQKIIEDAEQNLREATSIKELEQIRVGFLGKNGKITDILRGLKKLPAEEKKELGKASNMAKSKLEKMIADKRKSLEDALKEEAFKKEAIDVTVPGKQYTLGVKHPITRVIDEVLEVFSNMGYAVEEGPLIDTVFNTFDALNSPEDHPARDKTDTFYINEENCLRPHTSSVEIRALKKKKVPFKMISPGRCFRCDTPDATHSPMFHQIEGMIVDEGVTMADLKGTLDYLAKKLFGEKTKTKFRPHHFPFTEPSAEMDVSCFKCGGKGCNVCKGSGWIEILGCGMTHPNVHAVGDVDTEKYTGFAFGMGVERIAMLKYGIDDIRYFYENDMRFLEQFR